MKNDNEFVLIIAVNILKEKIARNICDKRKE